MKSSTRALQEIEEMEKSFKSNPEFFREEQQRRTVEEMKNSFSTFADCVLELLSSAANAKKNEVHQEVFTPAGLAKKLGVTKGVLSNWRQLGKGPKFFKEGKCVFYTEEAVKEWIASYPELQSTAQYYASRE